MYAGASAGGLNSLFLAAHENPGEALNKLDAYWFAINTSLLRPLLFGNMTRSLYALGGIFPIFNSIGLRISLFQQFGPLLLGQLSKKVTIVSFLLDDGNPDLSRRRWRTKIFHNYGAADNSDLRELVVDVGMRTSAFPIEQPIYQSLSGTGPGYVDGGLVANDPSVCALAQVLSRKQVPSDEAKAYASVDLSSTLMLSVGTGQNLIGSTFYVDPVFFNGSAGWGYFQWLFDFFQNRPLLLLAAFLQGSQDAAGFQASALLPPNNYFRVNPKVDASFILQEDDARAQAKKAAQWILDNDWLPPEGDITTEQKLLLKK
jgi:hypothetical protein